MDDRVESLPSPEARLLCNPAVSGNDGGHDCNPRTLAAAGAVLVGRLEGCADGRARCRANLQESLAAADAFVEALRTRIDEHIGAGGRRRSNMNSARNRMIATKRGTGAKAR